MTQITRRTLLAALPAGLATALVLGTAPAAWADKAPVYRTLLGTAIDGTDPVAYFTEGRPVEGSSSFTHEWNGATWRFASAANRDAFAAEPEKYAPQYGGYCAWAVAQGYTASTNPEAWKIVDGKLYLNFDRNVQGKWEKDIPGFISSADANWPKVLN